MKSRFLVALLGMALAAVVTVASAEYRFAPDDGSAPPSTYRFDGPVELKSGDGRSAIMILKDGTRLQIFYNDNRLPVTFVARPLVIEMGYSAEGGLETVTSTNSLTGDVKRWTKGEVKKKYLQPEDPQYQWVMEFYDDMSNWWDPFYDGFVDVWWGQLSIPGPTPTPPQPLTCGKGICDSTFCYDVASAMFDKCSNISDWDERVSCVSRAASFRNTCGGRCQYCNYN